MKIYLAGPMTGYPQFNFPAFIDAAEQLRAEGHEVFNPAEADIEEFGAEPFMNSDGSEGSTDSVGATLRHVLKKDCSWICDHAEAIALLPGWEKSSGAGVEWTLAKALGLKFIYLQTDNGS